MRHAILGAGGIGGLIAASLAKSGESVVLVVRPEALSNHPPKLRLESAFGNFEGAVEVASLVPPVDVVWITVKATQLNGALNAFPANSAAQAIVPLLNGVDHVAVLRARYGAKRVIPATIAVESERVAPGHVVHRSPFARINVSSAGRDRLQEPIDRLGKLGFTCQFVDNEPTLLWGKLVFLAPLALVSTASGKTTGEMAADQERFREIEDSVLEACSVAQAEKAKVDATAVLSLIRALPGHMRSSMQKDFAQNRQLELDAIAGPILRAAQRHGLKTPVTQKLVAEIEQKILAKQK